MDSYLHENIDGKSKVRANPYLGQDLLKAEDKSQDQLFHTTTEESK